MLRYIVVKGYEYYGDFENKVNKHIADGYTPCGGIAIDRVNIAYTGTMYAQAMTKEEKE